MCLHGVLLKVSLGVKLLMHIAQLSSPALSIKNKYNLMLSYISSYPKGGINEFNSLGLSDNFDGLFSCSIWLESILILPFLFMRINVNNIQAAMKADPTPNNV